jgi:hypothetical protein
LRSSESKPKEEPGETIKEIRKALSQEQTVNEFKKKSKNTITSSFPEHPKSKVAMAATKIQQVFRDIAIPASKSIYTINQNVFKNNSKRYGTVESPFRKLKSI